MSELLIAGCCCEETTCTFPCVGVCATSNLVVMPDLLISKNNGANTCIAVGHQFVITRPASLCTAYSGGGGPFQFSTTGPCANGQGFAYVRYSMQLFCTPCGGEIGFRWTVQFLNVTLTDQPTPADSDWIGTGVFTGASTTPITGCLAGNSDVTIPLSVYLGATDNPCDPLTEPVGELVIL